MNKFSNDLAALCTFPIIDKMNKVASVNLCNCVTIVNIDWCYLINPF